MRGADALKLPAGFFWGRVKGGSRLHIIAAPFHSALCGHAPGKTSKAWRMKDRRGWLRYGPDFWPYQASTACSDCQAALPKAPAPPARRPRIALQELGEAFPLPRPQTRVLGHPWPFPESVTADRGLVKNVTVVGNSPSSSSRKW